MSKKPPKEKETLEQTGIRMMIDGMMAVAVNNSPMIKGREIFRVWWAGLSEDEKKEIGGLLFEKAERTISHSHFLISPSAFLKWMRPIGLVLAMI